MSSKFSSDYFYSRIWCWISYFFLFDELIISGLNTNIVGTQMSAINNKIYEVLSWSSALANKGCSGVANGFNIISIIVVIIEGAKLVSSKSVIHFIIIKTSIYPNVQSKNKN